MSTSALLVLAVTSLFAATVNGALGYGYSSISVPVALMVTVGRVLNPAIVIIEVVINLYSLFWNRRAARRVVGRVLPLAIGLVPGVYIGGRLLGRVDPEDAKLFAFCALLPLILLQASGRRWAIRNERVASLPLGGAIGMLYGLTTISGPPIAIFWKNQGLSKSDFKVALAIIRSIESVSALIVYWRLGMFNHDSASVLPYIAPGVLIGFPLGHLVVNRVSVDTFRRVCMTFDVYLIAFGLARTLGELGFSLPLAYAPMIVGGLVDSYLLHQFFRRGKGRVSQPVLAVPIGVPGFSAPVIPATPVPGSQTPPWEPAS